MPAHLALHQAAGGASPAASAAGAAAPAERDAAAAGAELWSDKHAPRCAADLAVYKKATRAALPQLCSPAWPLPRSAGRPLTFFAAAAAAGVARSVLKPSASGSPRR